MTSIIALGHAGKAPADTQFVSRGLGADDPFAAQRLVAWTGDKQMSVGRVNWRGSLTHEHFPHMELLIVQSGMLKLETAAGAIRIAAGEAAVIGRGDAIGMDAETDTSWIFVATSAAMPDARSAKPLAQRIDCAVELAPSPPPAAEILISATPECRSFAAYANQASRTRIGIWDSTPYTRKQLPHKVNELMYILEGNVMLTDGSGHAGIFGPGDCVFVPHLTPCSWHSAVAVRKLYCVQDFES